MEYQCTDPFLDHDHQVRNGNILRYAVLSHNNGPTDRQYKNDHEQEPTYPTDVDVRFRFWVRSVRNNGELFFPKYPAFNSLVQKISSPF